MTAYVKPPIESMSTTVAAISTKMTRQFAGDSLTIRRNKQ